MSTPDEEPVDMMQTLADVVFQNYQDAWDEARPRIREYLQGLLPQEAVAEDNEALAEPPE